MIGALAEKLLKRCHDSYPGRRSDSGNVGEAITGCKYLWCNASSGLKDSNGFKMK
jgi:hypothetical protein